MGIPEGGVGMASVASPSALVHAEVWTGVKFLVSGDEEPF
jgi:hypothetical protein